jgi:hypothetical protein
MEKEVSYQEYMEWPESQRERWTAKNKLWVETFNEMNLWLKDRVERGVSLMPRWGIGIEAGRYADAVCEAAGLTA